MKHWLLLTAAILLAACSAQDAPTQMDGEGAETSAAELAPLDYIAPASSDADYNSPVAPYVLARGAGPSRLSPDGATIATRLSLTGTRQLYVMDADAEDPKLTLKMLSRGSGITFFEFSPTGALIYGADNNGDERENYWLVEPMGDGDWSEPRLLLPATAQGFRVFGGFPRYGSNGNMEMVYSSTERNGLDFDIYALNTETSEPELLLRGEGGNYVQAITHQFVLFTRPVGEDSDTLHVLDRNTGEIRDISIPSPRANHADAGFAETNEKTQIYFATNLNREFAALSSMNFLRYPNFDREIRTVHAVNADIDSLQMCGGYTVMFTVNRDGFSELYRYESSNEPVRIEGLPQGVYNLDCASDGSTRSSKALVRVTAPDIPGDLYLIDTNAETPVPRRVFASDYDDLDPASLILPESVRMTARDGVELQGLLYLPRGVSGKPPVIFQVHGGPTAQSRPTYNSSVQYLLSRGFAVFQPNVRGSTGFGRTYVTLDDREKRLDSVRDLVDMLDWLEEDGRVDTDRAAVMGGSYGGYMVNAVLADYPDAFDAGVSLFGVGDWVTALEVASPALKASDRIEYGDISDPEWRAFYEEISPIAKADNIRVPVLYSHGVMDPRIDIAETEVMVRALRENGIRADYVRIPDEGHGWRRLSNRLWYEQVQADFLEDVLGD